MLGVKVVNSEDRVEFLPVEVIKTTPEGLWIHGLQENVRVITVGQGFVRIGDKVVAIDESEIAAGNSGG